MDNQDFQQEIDLKDLVFTVLHKWRGIIITALVLGILLGGFKLGSGLASRGAGEEAQEIEQDYTDDLDSYKKSTELYEREVDFLKEKIKSQEEYYGNSVLMQINPYSKNVASADVFVKVGMPVNTNGVYVLDSDAADSILKAYEAIVNRADGVGNVSGTVIESKYLRELIATNVDYQGNFMNISVTYKDEAGAEEILNALLDSIKGEYADVEQELGNHKVVVMNEMTNVVTDQTLADNQQNCINLLATLRKNLTDQENTLKGLKPPAPPSEVSTVTSLKSGIKYGVLGGVLGAFLSVFSICVAFLMSDKLNSDKELKNRFGVRILGVFAQVPKQRVFSGVDRWLDRLEGRTSRKPAEVYEIMAVNVRNYMKEDKKILMLGSVANEKVMGIAEELRKRLPDTEIQVGQDMEHYAETLRLLPEAGQIILVEERGHSKYEEIQNQIEVIRSLDKDIIGSVLL